MKPSLIIIHAEIQESIIAILNQIKEAGIKAGLAPFKRRSQLQLLTQFTS